LKKFPEYSNLREILDLFKGYKLVTNDKNILVNINNPDDFRKYFQHG
jgi:hypothetical protein